jgi:murein DD-endopeptidase MepM/ murein hydrolase activator NlpD
MIRLYGSNRAWRRRKQKFALDRGAMRNRILATVALVLAIAAPAYAQTPSALTQDDVDRARAERTAAANSLGDLTSRFEIAAADEVTARERIAELARAVSKLELEIADRRVEVDELVRTRYMSGGPEGTERIFTAKTFKDLPIQNEYYQVMTERDLAMLNGLAIAEKLHKEQQVRLDESLEDQVELVAEIIGLRDEILETLEKADADFNAIAAAFQKQEEERKRLEEEARLRKLEEDRKRRETEAAAAAAAAVAATSTTTTVATSTTPGAPTTTAAPTTTLSPPTTVESPSTTSGTTTTTAPPPPPPVVTSGKACPINGATSFSDTWGARRSGGRSHKGVDMMAGRNTPLVAIESGVITRTSNSSLGGISIYLTGESGSRYYYAHLDHLESGVMGGLNVTVGQQIGFVGSTGNASDWLPHLHFQYAPKGSDWINPYPLVKELCG